MSGQDADATMKERAWHANIDKRRIRCTLSTTGADAAVARLSGIFSQWSGMAYRIVLCEEKMMTRPNKANLIALSACALIVVMISAFKSSTVALGLKTIVALPVGILAVVANNDLLIVLAGIGLWAVAGIATVLSGQNAWRNVSWALLGVLVVGTTISMIGSEIIATPRGGM